MGGGGRRRWLVGKTFPCCNICIARTLPVANCTFDSLYLTRQAGSRYPTQPKLFLDASPVLSCTSVQAAILFCFAFLSLQLMCTVVALYIDKCRKLIVVPLLHAVYADQRTPPSPHESSDRSGHLSSQSNAMGASSKATAFPPNLSTEEPRPQICLQCRVSL